MWSAVPHFLGKKTGNNFHVKSEWALCDGDLLSLTFYMCAVTLFFLMTGPC